jgi:hypothetical protein
VSLASWKSRSKKFIDVDRGLAQNRAKRPLFHIPRMMRQSDFSSIACVSPDLVTSRALPVEDEPELAEFLNYIAVFEPG